jgi:hypothetical protein
MGLRYGREQMMKNNRSQDVTDLLEHNSSSIEKSSCYNNITYSIIEVLRFSSFILLSRFHYDHNLRLAYLRSHSQHASLTQASEAMGVRKTIFHTQILPDNPSILSEKRSISGWGRGGSERIMILSLEAKEHLNLVRALTVHRLGEAECQNLRIAAEKIAKGIDKIERKQNRERERVKETYQLRKNDPAFSIEQFLPMWKKMGGFKSVEELREFLEMRS